MKKILVITIAVMLHVAQAHAAAYSCRQGVDSLTDRNKALKVYPNPVSAQCTIVGNRNMRQLTLYTVGGQMVRSWTAKSKTLQLDTPNLSRGTYLLRVAFEDGTCASRIILKQ